MVDNDIVNVDDEIDPRDLDIGFHEDITSAPRTTPTLNTVASDPQVPGQDPAKHYNQDTNFFAQPGILTGVFLIDDCSPFLLFRVVFVILLYPETILQLL